MFPSARMPRKAVCQVCRCVSTMPGMAILSRPSMISASSTAMSGRISRMTESSMRMSVRARSPSSGSTVAAATLRMSVRMVAPSRSVRVRIDPTLC